jgi:hypothetical protein
MERFEKLDPFPILGFRMNFLKDVKRSAAAEQAFTGLRTSGVVARLAFFGDEPVARNSKAGLRLGKVQESGQGLC